MDSVSKGLISLTGCDKKGVVVSSVYVNVSKISFFAEPKNKDENFNFGSEVLVGSFSVLVKELPDEIIARINQSGILLH